MPASPRSPLDDTDRLVVDGTNLLHRLGGGDAPPATIVGRLRAAVPMTIAVELVFDGIGHGVSGRVAQAMHVRYAGRRTADEAILELVGDASSGSTSPVVAARTLVVTDDRDLRLALTARGSRTAGVAWLLGRMQVAPVAPASGRRAPAIGSGRAPRPSPSAGGGGSAGIGHTGAGAPGSASDDADERRGWKPGRGATAKTGAPHKVARHRRHPRHP